MVFTGMANSKEQRESFGISCVSVDLLKSPHVATSDIYGTNPRPISVDVFRTFQNMVAGTNFRGVAGSGST